MATLLEQVQEKANEAVRVTEVYFFTDLDFTPESIQKLEGLFDEVNYSWPYGKNAESIEMFTELWGCYLGEVFRRNCGGEWRLWEHQTGVTWALATPKQNTIFPLSKVYKRLVNGPEDNVWNFYQVFAAME